ncbi:flagellar M-ring protein FliF [Thermovibrio ammonificans HB-1]|uniref:Flagellar M-ring protein n=1 Tax=Thermovibrio ammonificans (strain DSM 15698 / JCM 12110 / HB-1) TaxID=648996 RepID=E8T483_THEA1|nr:flagellar basal-body MS-ring/collar protein FliF [Thermovibrio ammonificans]ADU97412.1 flagellar M-ring protein FliF [Thermovibrio ammonificans HB-1]
MELRELSDKLTAFLREKANPRNIVLVLGALTLVVFLSLVLVRSYSNQEYAVLYTHLSPDDAGEILTVLQQEKIPYKVEGDGSIILVPKDKVYEVRLQLAAKGLPHGKVVGFEIFDKPKLGITQFQQNVEYLRALEGELERTIEQLDAVRSAKVNIALPKDSIFVRPEQEPKASVLVDLWPGRDLTPEQVKAIIFLVSHAVPGLKPENVTVVDTRGRVLSDLVESDNSTYAVSSKELKIKRQLERDIERKVESMLSQVLGGGKVVVRASVEVETGKVETQKEIYDPDMTAVVSQRKVQEKEVATQKQPQGAPGTTTNVPPVVNFGPNAKVVQKEKKDVTTNYDVSKTIERSVTPVFRIKRITVGVLVDGRYEKVKGPKGTVEYKFVPRSPQEIKTYEEIVKSVIGYDPKRGDRVTVASVPFETQLLAGNKPKEEKGFPWQYAAGVGALVAVLLGLLLMKLLKKPKAEAPPAGLQPGETLAQSLEEGLAARKEEIEEINLESDPIYLKIVEVAKDYPDLISNVITKWMREEGLR